MPREKDVQLKPAWELPVAPICPHCAFRAQAAAEWTGDGWLWGWECSLDGDPDLFWWCHEQGGVGPRYDWPFLGDYVRVTDWEQAGVHVV